MKLLVAPYLSMSMLHSRRRENALSICAVDFGHPLLLAVSTNVGRCFKLLQYSPPKLSVSSGTLEGASRNPNCSRDHLLSAPERRRENTSDSRICIRRVSMQTAARSNRHIVIPWRLSRPRGSCLSDAYDMQGRQGRRAFSVLLCFRNSAKHVEQRKGDVDIVVYSDTLVDSHVRRIYRRKVGKKPMCVLKSYDMFGRGRETSQFYRLYARL